MTSQALAKWSADRSKRLDRLFAAHDLISADTHGRTMETDELDHAILLRLAAEFQGFSRDLHDDCIEMLMSAASKADPRLRFILVSYNLQFNRRLDSGNASPGSLGTDFGRLGVQLWLDLKVRFPTQVQAWNAQLTMLNMARNGIAHDDSAKIQEVEAAGWPLTLATACRWRDALDSLAEGMDTVCKAHLHDIVGVEPWY
ncbi:hypothetical protein ACTG9Q_21645 [Actinokineospora sp. 24-640]